MSRGTFLFRRFSCPPVRGIDASYFRDIRPIIQRQCQGCHQPNLKSSNLDLTSYEGIQSGGKHGPGAKTLLGYMTGEASRRCRSASLRCPPEQIELFRAWIAAGAKDDTPAEAREDSAIGQAHRLHAAAGNQRAGFFPDGKKLAVSGNREILIHSLDGAAPPRAAARPVGPYPLAGFLERWLYAGGRRRHARAVRRNSDLGFSAAKLKHSLTLTGDTVFGASHLAGWLQESPSGAPITSVRIVDAASGKELFKIGNHENWVLGTIFGVDGKRIVSVGRDRAAKLTDATSGAFLENVNLLRGELAAIARHPTKDIVVIGGEDRMPYIYMMDRGQNMKIADDSTLIRKLERQDGAIAALAWSPDGTHIAVGGASPEVTIYDAESGKRIAACKGHRGRHLCGRFQPRWPNAGDRRIRWPSAIVSGRHRRIGQTVYSSSDHREAEEPEMNALCHACRFTFLSGSRSPKAPRPITELAAARRRTRPRLHADHQRPRSARRTPGSSPRCRPLSRW